jgi:hypothetical protein
MTLVAHGTSHDCSVSWGRATRAALDELLPLIYDELPALAHLQRRRWHGDYTLDTTALVHEAYLKLLGQKRLDATVGRTSWRSPRGRCDTSLCNYARDRRRQKRGGGADRLCRSTTSTCCLERSRSRPSRLNVLGALDDALRRLEATSTNARAMIVECRFFGGDVDRGHGGALSVRRPATVKAPVSAGACVAVSRDAGAPG